MAEELGTSTNFLSFMERGIKAPSFENLELIAKVLEVEVAELFYKATSLEKAALRVRRSTHRSKALGQS